MRTRATYRSLAVFDDDTPGRSDDVAPDGQRLFVVKRATPEVQTKLHVINNWLDVARP